VASIFKNKTTGKWMIAYYVRPRVRKVVTGCTDHKATKSLADKLETDAFQRRSGLIDPQADRFAVEELRPMVEKDAAGLLVGGHMADFYAVLVGKGVSAKQAAQVRGRVLVILKLAKAERISQLVPSAVQAALAAVRDQVKSKNSKQTKSLQTVNHHLRAIKQFSRWLWTDHRARADSLVGLKGFNVKLDRRHDRRAMTDDEITRLIQTAQAGPTVLGMAGVDRAMLYRVAVGTGFRASEIGSLTSESFDLDADPPTITIEAGYSKHRRKDVQPIRPDLADLLAPWLDGKAAGQVVFAMPEKPVMLMRADLDAARQSWIGEGANEKDKAERAESHFLAYEDAAGQFCDFHALRHTFISRLVQSGASVKVAQDLARHSSPMLTLGRYAHVQIADHTKALDALPNLEPMKDTPDQQEAKATGTYDGRPGSGIAPDRARKAHGMAKPVINRQDVPLDAGQSETLQLLAPVGTCQQPALSVTTAPVGARTRNLRFRRPETLTNQAATQQELTQSCDGPNSAPMSAQSPQPGNNRPESPEPMSADLVAIMDAWPSLPDALKAGIVAMVKASAKVEGGQQ